MPYALPIIFILCRVVLVYAIISLFENLVHRHLMHRRRIARLFRNPLLENTYNDHIEHHAQCYDTFNHEDRPCGLRNLTVSFFSELLVVALPALVCLAFDPLTAGFLVAGALLHGVLWNAVHSEMHRPQKTWFSRTFVFQGLNRFHFLHHRHMGTNFNVLFLGFDWILGTAAKATEADRLEIEQQTWRVRIRRAERKSPASS
jgi:hypothetical protein